MKKHTPGPKVEYQSNNGVFFAPPLLPCPCCGGSADIHFRGNDRSRSRQVKIKCGECRLERTNATLRNSSEWIARISIDQWNKRPAIQAAAPEMYDVLIRLTANINYFANGGHDIPGSIVSLSERAGEILSKIQNQTNEND